MPFRLQFIPVAALDHEQVVRNIQRAAGMPRAVTGKHVHPVAVCGGGPSIGEHLGELRAWPGDIWAINYTADWLLERGIDCTMLTIDSLVKHSKAHKRLVATNCDPALFEGDVRCFALCEYEEGGLPGGCTTATRAPALSLRLGYPGAVFFGCESSYAQSSHADRNEEAAHELLIRANGQTWKTTPELCLQAEGLSEVLRLFPSVFKSRSGGLLDAMTADDGWSVVGVSEALKAHLIEVNGDCGLYDEPYREQESH